MDQYYMRKALELAIKGEGYTNPNPLVGAVIVKDGKIIGEGYHETYGKNHAEINAFQNSIEDVSGATMYVTLEPCSHYGKTPPCTDAIIKKGISKVVVSLLDPNPLVAGKGIKKLREHGIEVVEGVLEGESKKINEIFIKYITMHLPFGILKTAMTLDGKICTSTGDSKWITNEKSRAYVHELRNRVSAIMVGVNTVIMDNPYLTTRLVDRIGTDPIRVIVDTTARIPMDSNVLHLKSQAKTVVATTELASKDKLEQLKELGVELIITPLHNQQVDLNYLMKTLGEQQVDSVLLEGGSDINFSAVQAGIIDKVLTFISPKIIGGRDAKTTIGGEGFPYMKNAIHLTDVKLRYFEEDILVEGYI